MSSRGVDRLRGVEGGIGSDVDVGAAVGDRGGVAGACIDRDLSDHCCDEPQGTVTGPRVLLRGIGAGLLVAKNKNKSDYLHRCSLLIPEAGARRMKVDINNPDHKSSSCVITYHLVR